MLSLQQGYELYAVCMIEPSHNTDVPLSINCLYAACTCKTTAPWTSTCTVHRLGFWARPPSRHLLLVFYRRTHACSWTWPIR
jgi:hypothetical protein